MQELPFISTERLLNDMRQTESDVSRLSDFLKGLNPQGVVATALGNVMSDLGKQILMVKREIALRVGPLAEVYPSERFVGDEGVKSQISSAETPEPELV